MIASGVPTNRKVSQVIPSRGASVTISCITAPPGSFVTCFLGALWLGRRIESRFILHGTLVGVVAVLIYVSLTRAQPEPYAYLVAHALKPIGWACGGWVAQRRRSPSPAQPIYN